MRKFVSSGVILLVLCPFLIGAADKSKKAYELIYEDVQLLKQQVHQLDKRTTQNTEDIQTLLNLAKELVSLSEGIRQEQTNLKEEQKKLPSQYQILIEKLETLTTQISTFTEELMQIKKTIASPATSQQKEVPREEETESQALPDETQDKQIPEEAPKEDQTTVPPLSPRELYNTAYADYLQGNFELAVDGFKIYLEQYADSPFADNAVYWIGECYFSQRKFDEAIEYFNQLILNYPQGDKVPAAYLKKGISLVELGKKEEALSVFRLLISKFPLEEETKIAQEKIKEIISQ